MGKEEKYLYNDRALEKVLHERGVKDLELWNPDKTLQVTGDALQTLINQLDRFHADMEYPLLAAYPPALIETLISQKIDPKTLHQQDTAEALVNRLQAAHPDWTIALEAELEPYHITLTPSASDLPTLTLTDDMLDSLEYEHLTERFPPLKPWLSVFHGDPLLLIIAQKDEQLIPNFIGLKTTVQERGKKGLSLQRFKGLGEMMPVQLWDTTMNPDTRTLLRVEIEEAAVADKLFDILMGERVEPRRAFIESNARLVKNLDI